MAPWSRGSPCVKHGAFCDERLSLRPRRGAAEARRRPVCRNCRNCRNCRSVACSRAARYRCAAILDDPRALRIAEAARLLNERRDAWLNPPDLVRRVPEVVEGFPNRLLPVSPEAEAALKKRTLTNLYNARPAWLDHAHRALDEAVADAYGWGDDWRAGALTDDDILARLFALNQRRAVR